MSWFKRDKIIYQPPDETERIKACYRVIYDFREQLGYPLQRVVTREELELWIYGAVISQNFGDNLVDVHKFPGLSAGRLHNRLLTRIKRLGGLNLGYVISDGKKFNINLADADRDAHCYIIGHTNSGKTNEMLNFILHDILAGHGLIILATETEMIYKIFSAMPDWRIDDVYYVNPKDNKSPLGFNLLNLESNEDIDFKLNAILNIFNRLVEPSSRMNDILLHTFYTLMKVKGSTLLDIQPLLSRTNDNFRRTILDRVSDNFLYQFWKETYIGYPKDAHLPLIHRLNKLIGIPESPLRNLLCQKQSSFSFRDIMDNRKILIFNLADGYLGPENAEILGRLVMIQIQTALMSRADIFDEKKRVKCHCYVDEIQKFVEVDSIEDMFSRGRRYGMRFCVAHQDKGQMSHKTFKAMMGNGCTICFAVDYEDAVEFSNAFKIERDGETVKIPPERFTGLQTGEAIAKLKKRYVMPLKTHWFGDRINEKKARRVINRSRENYGQPSGVARGAERVPGELIDSVDRLILNNSGNGDNGGGRIKVLKPGGKVVSA